MLPDEFPAFLKSFTSPPPVSVRLNPLKHATLKGNAVPWCTRGIYLNARPRFTLDPLFHAGAYYVQEASSMFLEHLVLQLRLHQQPIRILDAAAAPGGKSTHLLSLIHPESLLVANETIRSRLPALTENLTRWGYPNVVITCNDPQHFGALKGYFDVIVLDAPCSGEGLFRKDASAVRQWSQEHVKLCALRQQRILQNLWPVLRPGGLLIYSTCTYNAHENEEVLLKLVKSKEASFAEVEIPPDWGILHSREPVSGYRFFPHRVWGEGFFVSVLRKTAEEPVQTVRAKPENVSPDVLQTLRSFLAAPVEMGYLRFSDQVAALPASLMQDAAWLMQKLNVVSAGTAMAKVARNRITPLHPLAMSVYLNRNTFPETPLDLGEAIRFLRKESIKVEGPFGYCLMKYQNVPLGWVNIVPGRANNLYPSGWRIRLMD
ncbi:MAG: rRNA cytosine-C5-methyltransferase [Cyclobacteriaceae bacterium]|nr:MAG: rRNA cytosine-C5-methyltransferase [Cyclobacteriaceae bacterium]